MAIKRRKTGETRYDLDGYEQKRRPKNLQKQPAHMFLFRDCVRHLYIGRKEGMWGRETRCVHDMQLSCRVVVVHEVRGKRANWGF